MCQRLSIFAHGYCLVRFPSVLDNLQYELEKNNNANCYWFIVGISVCCRTTGVRSLTIALNSGVDNFIC